MCFVNIQFLEARFNLKNQYSILIVLPWSKLWPLAPLEHGQTSTCFHLFIWSIPFSLPFSSQTLWNCLKLFTSISFSLTQWTHALKNYSLFTNDWLILRESIYACANVYQKGRNAKMEKEYFKEYTMNTFFSSSKMPFRQLRLIYNLQLPCNYRWLQAEV